MSSYFKQGIFTPLNAAKYLGTKNPTYRSSWELKFCRWADLNERILAWGSENIIIPYLNPLDNKTHRYFVDNFIVFKDDAGNKKKFLIEIKPSKQTIKPEPSTKKKKSTVLYEQTTYIINTSKWTAAREWARKRGWEFLILTEKELGIK